MEDLLLQVRKPGRYIGKEWNIARKDFDKASVKFALCFPDLYEIGMSNLGIRILYGLMNERREFACERFFAPDFDFEQLIRLGKTELLSLESRKSLSQFDIIGFSLGSELAYTNVLNILDLGKVPLRASMRDSRFPLVIAGGPCVANPEPMHEFIDVFLIGEAEELILEFLEIYQRHSLEYRNSKISKEELLIILSQLEGVYAPSLYAVTYDALGHLESFSPRFSNVPSIIKKRFVKDLNSSFFPTDWLVPYIQVAHDRVTLEIMRGCPNRCRFCQARVHYFPFRQRIAESVFRLAQETITRTGYEELALGGLSVSDYSHLESLLEWLIREFKPKGVGVSLPSLKAKDTIGAASELIARIKKTGLTFAPEAGSERLRSSLAKDFNEADFFENVRKAYAAGYFHVKLYFMIGLPGEREEDLDAIIDFSMRVSELRKQVNRPAAEVHLSINTCIPKPHTPLQWCRMEHLEDIRQKQEYLRRKARSKKLKLTFHNGPMSIIEGVFSRGDRRLSEVIFNAFGQGARFDAWSNYFDFSKWERAFSDAKLDPHAYLRQIGEGETLPWDFLDLGVQKEFLREESNKVFEI